MKRHANTLPSSGPAGFVATSSAPCAQSSSGIDSALLLRLHSVCEIPQFWLALQAVLRELMPYDALVVYLNFLDFTASWRAAKMLITPNARRPSPWFEARRRVDMTPEFVLAQPPGLKIYRLSDVVPDAGELRRTAFYRNYLAPGGWQHLACQLFWRNNTVCSQIAIRRVQSQGDFSAEEVLLLEELHPHIDSVINRLLTLENERARRHWMEDLNDQLTFGLMSLDWALNPVFANTRAFEQSACWNYGSKDAQRFQPRAVFHAPAAIVSGCADLKARWLAGAGSRNAKVQEEASLTVMHPSEAGLSATITMQADRNGLTTNPGFLVQMQHLSGPAHDSRLAHARFETLTSAERELVRAVCHGSNNAEIAYKLGKRIKTVKGQLTSVYRKLNVSSRARLLAEFAHLMR
jgi:DNA-binding CsgD family transcriptional regulator